MAFARASLALRSASLFCNCATVYICFSLDSPVLAALLSKQASLAPQQLQQAALEALFHSAG